MSTKNNGNAGLILVLGATGKTGKRVVARLLAGGHEVRLGSRAATPAFDWEDPTTWEGALRGVKAVYVAFQPDLSVPGALKTLAAFFEAATVAGVSKAVLLSGRGEPEAEAAERLLQATSLDWTIIRASWFFQNFSEGFFLEGILAGTVALPENLADEPFVDAEDIAEIAARALTGEEHGKRLYEVTGPQSISFRSAFAEIAAATGRDIRYIDMPMDEYNAALVDAQLPPEIIELTVYLFSTLLDGRNTPITGGVESALGKKPARFSEYVARTSANGDWLSGRADGLAAASRESVS